VIEKLVEAILNEEATAERISEITGIPLQTVKQWVEKGLSVRWSRCHLLVRHRGQEYKLAPIEAAYAAHLIRKGVEVEILPRLPVPQYVYQPSLRVGDTLIDFSHGLCTLRRYPFANAEGCARRFGYKWRIGTWEELVREGAAIGNPVFCASLEGFESAEGKNVGRCKRCGSFMWKRVKLPFPCPSCYLSYIGRSGEDFNDTSRLY